MASVDISVSETLLGEARATAAVDVTREDPILDGRFRLLRQLGVGGMGIVYEAERLVPGTERALVDSKVAIKLLRSSLADAHGAIERLRLEARAASAIGDPHIVEVLDCAAMDSGGAYVVMERLDGTDLYEALDQKPMEWRRVCRIGAQIAKALCSAHRQGVWHRDLKPENVFLITRNGEPDFVKILDFGIAKLQSADTRLTLAGEVLGTPEYMSPEQCSAGPLDHRTDIYSLGVVLFEMLSGTVPFESDDLRQLCLLHIEEPPPSVDFFTDDLPPALSALIDRCLEKRPDDRFAAMSEVAAALEAIAAGNEPEASIEASNEPADARVSLEGRESVALAPSQADLITVRPPMPTPHAADGRAAARRPLRWAIAGAIALSALAAGVFAWAAPNISTGREVAPDVADVAPEPEVASAEEPAALARASAAASPEPPPEPSRPTLAVATTIELSSTPAGADVYDGETLLGVTPVDVPRPPEGRHAFTLRLEGHLERRIVVSTLSRGTLDVPLVPERAPPAVASRGRRAAPAAEAPGLASPETSEPARDTEPVIANRGQETRVSQDSGPAAVTEQNAFLDPWDS